MYSIQKAMIKHLQEGRHNYFNYVDKNNIKAYAGELTPEKIIQLSNILPSIMVMPQPSKPVGPQPDINLDIIVITKSDSFDKVTNQNNNMQLTEDVYKFILKNPHLSDDDKSWQILFENLEIKLVAIDSKFAVVVIGCQLTEL